MVAAILLAIGAAGWVTARRAAESSRLVAKTHRTIDQLQSVRRGVSDGRTELRNYLLTLDSTALQASRRAQDASRVAAAALQSMVDENAAAHERTRALQSALLALDSSRAGILRARATGTESALAVLTSAGATYARTHVNALLDSIEQIERAELEARGTDFERDANRVFMLLATALLATAVLIVVAAAYRRRESHALAAAATQYRAMTEQSPDGIVVQQRGIIRYANAAAATLLGFDAPDALLGRPFFDFVHPDERAAAHAFGLNVIEEGATIAPQSRVFVTVDGATIDTEVRAAPIMFQGSVAAQVVIRDLRIRRAAERKAAASEQRYRGLVEVMEEGVVLHDATHRVTFWNPAAIRILGLTGDQLSGVSAYDARWRATDSSGRSLTGDEHCSTIASRTGKISSAVMGVERGDGGRVWVKVNAVPLFDDTGAVHEVEVTFSDITAVVDASRRVEESEARFRVLAEQTSDLISQRTLDHRFEYASPSHTEVIGWTPEDLHGTSAFDYLHPEDAQRIRDSHPIVADGSQGPIVTRVRHKEGHYVMLESVVTPILHADGTASGYQVSARDVSVRLALEERLRQIEKMEAMERMATGVAHDFNNLLGVVRTAADQLGDPMADNGTRDALISDITLATERAAALTAQLLTFAQRRHSEPTFTDVTAVLQHNIPLLNRVVGPSINVELHLSADIEAVSVKAEPGQLEQVLYNLIVNARDAMPAGGLVHVRASVAEFSTPQAHRHGTIEAGAYVAIVVADNGLGMSDAVYARLFDPFFTTKPIGQGSGLGLPSVLGIVEQAGGAVAAQSIDGVGSSFTVYLPIASRAKPLHLASDDAEREPSDPVPEPLALNPPPEPEADLVLVVDDEAALRRGLARALTRMGFRVLEAASGPDALVAMRRHGHAVRVLITDVRMPAMSGFELVDALLAEGIDPPVLFISGQLDAPIPTHWPDTRTRRFLAKPFATRDFAEVVDRLAERAPLLPL